MSTSAAPQTFQNAVRFQESILTPVEKRVLRWLAERMPPWVNSDHLTLLGFAAMLLTGLCYFFASKHPAFLLLASGCLALNWFGDSLDGTLARYRMRQRPRYGFYVDHMVDAFGISFVMAGLGLSGYMSPMLALGFLVAYFLTNIEIYLATYTMGVFKLSYGILGPTELRVVVAIGNMFLVTRKTGNVAGHPVLLCDAGAIVGIAILLVITIVSTIRHTSRLYNEERLPELRKT
jgi:phosphatidylglycerophosphate synthase